MAKETIEPVQVIVNNFPITKESVQGINDSSKGILDTLKGKDYKDTFKSIRDIESKSLDKIIRIESTLSSIEKSIRGLGKGAPFTQSPTSTRTDDKDWKDSIAESLRNIETEVTGNSNIKTATDSIKQILEKTDSTKLSEETNKLIQEIGKQLKLAKESQERKYDRDELSNRQNTSQQKAYQNALNSATEINRKQLSVVDSINQIGRNFLGLFESNFKKVFEQWDRQIATLKEQGMGSPNAIQLNRTTRMTMDAAERTLGFNISIDKAIKSTNAMISAGQNPRYIRENNNQLIMGLQAVGLDLSPNTIREMGNAVFDATQVKDLVGGWASLVSPDTENALNRAEVARFIDSDDFKKTLSFIMKDANVSYAEVQQEIIKKTTDAIRGGVTDGQAALRMAMVATQKEMVGNVAFVPENTQTYIGTVQAAGTFTGVENLPQDYANALRAAHSNAETMRRMTQANASLAMGGDFSILDNIILNDPRTRHIQTQEERERGMYEGLIPRMMKWTAGNLPAESIGGLSQDITGNSSFLTQQGFSFIGGALKDLKENPVQTTLLTQIAFNTSKMSTGLGGISQGLFGTTATSVSGNAVGGMAKTVSGLASTVGPALVGIAGLGASVGLIATTISTGAKAGEDAEALTQRIEQSVEQERQLTQQYRDALLTGDKELIERTNKQLQEAQSRVNQEIDKRTTLQDTETDKYVEAGAMTGGGIAGTVSGALLGAKLGKGGGIKGMLIGGSIGAIVGTLASYFISSGLVESDTFGRPDYEKEREEERSKYSGISKAISIANKVSGTLSNGGVSLPEFANGGVVEEEQVAKIGEGGKPEVVIPLTGDPSRAEELMSQASQTPGANPEIANMMSTGKKETKLADLIIQYAKSAVGIPYIASGNPLVHPEKGMVCNQLVEYAYNKAGVPLDSKTVHYHLQSGKWGLTEDPQPGFVIFSNYGYKQRYGLDDYGHLGVIGYGNERIHASSKEGKVVIDPNLTKTLSYEKASKWINSGKKPYVFGFLKGVDYGTGVTPTEINSVVETKEQTFTPLPIQQTTTADVEPEAEYTHIPDDHVVSPIDNSIHSYYDFLSKYTPEVTSLNEDLLQDTLNSKKYNTAQTFLDNLSMNNPFGLLDDTGSPKEYKSMEAGVVEFISKLEDMYDTLAQMDYNTQLELLKERKFITGNEYTRIKDMENDRLVSSLDRLSRSMEERNKQESRRNISSYPSSQYPNRSYV